MAKKYGKTVLAFAGTVTEDAYICKEHGIDALYPIKKATQSLEDAMQPSIARKNMIDAVKEVFSQYKN